MACLGVHYAITADAAERLTRDWPSNSDDAISRLEDLDRQYDALHDEGWVASTEHAWDGIHRSLTDGKLELGTTPRHLCILGATERLWVRREDGLLEYMVNLLEPGDVRRVADAIRGVELAELLGGYGEIDPKSFYALNMSAEDFEYTWDNFEALRRFFERAADAGRWVVFKVDQ
ncbi:MAG: YfbM family protein [Planctomycetes bacterium]|nr:YfbM family protein [Planctomycetota bacterium]